MRIHPRRPDLVLAEDMAVKGFLGEVINELRSKGSEDFNQTKEKKGWAKLVWLMLKQQE